MTERICSAEGCGTVLTSFNSNDFCALHNGEQAQFIAVCLRKGKDNKGREITYRHIAPLPTLSRKNAVNQTMELSRIQSWKYVVLVHKNVAKKEIKILEEFGDTVLKQEWIKRNKGKHPVFSGKYYSEKNLLEESFPLIHALAAH